MEPILGLCESRNDWEMMENTVGKPWDLGIFEATLHDPTSTMLTIPQVRQEWDHAAEAREYLDQTAEASAAEGLKLTIADNYCLTSKPPSESLQIPGSS